MAYIWKLVGAVIKEIDTFAGADTSSRMHAVRRVNERKRSCARVFRRVCARCLLMEICFDQIDFVLICILLFVYVTL